MKYLNTTFYITIFTLSLLASAFVVSPVYAHAANLEVDFQTEPLFNEVNFLPGNEVVRTVGVTNNSETEQNVIVESINATDSEGLGDELNLIIKEGETTLYSDTLGAFLRTGEVPLSSLSPAGSATYSFGVTLNSDAENDTQGTTLGFDLCVGFEGGDTNCGDTVTGGQGGDGDGGIVDEGGEGGGGDSGGGGSGNGGGSSGGTGGGGGGQNITLVITNEAVLNVDITDGKAVITWDTNHLATSQVVYGPESDPTFPFSINLTVDPYFGYPLGTVEDPNKVTSHSVELEGLTPGETYRFRVVSRASPPTVSYEHTFTFTGDGSGALSYLSYGDNNADSSGGGETVVINNTDLSQTNNNIVTAKVASREVFAGGIEGGGVGIPGPEDIAEEEVADEIIEDIVQVNPAAALFGFPDSLSDWLKYIFSFVVIVIIIYLVASRRRK